MNECKCSEKDKDLGWYFDGFVCLNCGLHEPGEVVILTQADYDKMNAVVEAVNSYMQFYDLAENMFFPHPPGEGIMAERRKKLYLALTALEGE